MREGRVSWVAYFPPKRAGVQGEMRLCLQNHKVVAMNYFAFGNRFDADFGGAGPRDAASKFSPVRVADADDFPSFKIAFNFGDARQKQAPALLAQRSLGAIVHRNRSGRAMIKRDPSFA